MLRSCCLVGWETSTALHAWAWAPAFAHLMLWQSVPAMHANLRSDPLLCLVLSLITVS